MRRSHVELNQDGELDTVYRVILICDSQIPLRSCKLYKRVTRPITRKQATYCLSHPAL